MRNSPNSKHHLSLGQCYKAAGVKAQAFDELERSINLNPNDSNLFEMAEFMLQDDKRDEAIRYLRQRSNQYIVGVYEWHLTRFFSIKNRYLNLPKTRTGNIS